VGRARARLARSGLWDVSTLHYARRTKGIAPTRTSPGHLADLADGVVLVRAKHPDAKPQVLIIAVFEAKSRSNRGDVITRSGEELGQLGWDFERFSEEAVELEVLRPDRTVERRLFRPDEIRISRYETQWRAFLPKGETLSKKGAERLRQDLSFEWTTHNTMDHQLQRIADGIVRALVRGDL